MIPLIQITTDDAGRGLATQDFDVVLEGEATGWAEQTLRQVTAVASRQYTPKLFAQGNADFQITRGLLGVTV